MKIIIIGSGLAGITFAEKYRALQPDDSITVLTREQHGYYSRPMLSHGFSRNDIEQAIILKPFNQIIDNNICIISGVEVEEINRSTKIVSVRGANELESLEYDKLILAQGSAAMIPPPFLPFQEHFFSLNSLVDLKKLRKLRQTLLTNDRPPHWAVIGGGLIGCEVASDLAKAGDKVTLFHAMERLMERQLVEADSATLLNVMQASSIEVLMNQQVQGFQKQGDKFCVNVADGDADEFDAVIVSCGFKPRIELASACGLVTGRGIKVNQFLQTTDENISALGDVAELPNGKLYAFIMPIRKQAAWLASYLAGTGAQAWTPQAFKAKAKVHGFEAAHPYIF